MFAWVDETGCNYKDMLRKYGYAIQSERAAIETFLLWGQHISSIAAICIKGLLALETTSNLVNGDMFFDFSRATLIPEMLPFDGSNAKSIVIMDNCSIHHVQEVKDLFSVAGILVLYLPPYSPDLNPIEMAFSYINKCDVVHVCVLVNIHNVQSN